ncbi:hypothetical protein FW778_12970 [Ginsengibacter hankyongi]|uniref:Glycosyltransferase RgtA/B/C/D-like domain-containing protein n=1 Tax=Ginsengibacter hankyongi TaxID=2607284 RepID=A0A5J5IFD6_9BACT|nr:hypothetical protein [Ginsengibacter hankyongi]KAA9038469.1 hypothetical protein FW778_12970 [Ginsengibacter hankyongi]
MFQLLSLKKNIDSLIAALAGFSIIFLYTRHGGIGLCPDGVVYTTTAKNILSRCQLIDFRHYALVEFPAFYPLFLSAIMLVTGLQPLVFGAILNALLFSIVIYISGSITEQFSHKSKWYKAAILSCIVLSPGLLEVYSMLWSETIFILFLLLFIIMMHRYFQMYSRKALIAAAVITSLACVTRYAGITIIGTGIILLLLDTKLAFPRKLKDIVLFGLISPLLLIINLLRNYMVGGTMTGIREKSFTPLSKNMHDAGAVFCDWLPFFNGHYNGAVWLTLFIVCFLAFIFLKQYFRKLQMVTYENIAVSFALFYLSFMIIIASISRFETLDSRFLSPAFIPLIWSCSNWMISSSQKIKRVNKKLMVIGAAAIFLCFQYGQLAADYETWDGVKDAGIPGYTENQWKYSPTVLYIQKDSLPFKKGYTIYSNAYDAVYFFTGRPGKFLPNKENKSKVQEFLNDSHCYVIWFDDGENPDLVGMNFITKVKKMKLVKQFDDGAIYEYYQ